MYFTRATTRIRTEDLFLTMEALYRLSYGGMAPVLSGVDLAKRSPHCWNLGDVSLVVGADEDNVLFVHFLPFFFGCWIIPPPPDPDVRALIIFPRVRPEKPETCMFPLRAMAFSFSYLRAPTIRFERTTSSSGGKRSIR